MGKLLVHVGHCLVVCNDRAQMALVFCERNLAVHPFNYLIVVDLLLNVQLG
jgi:hypothetical protein